VDKAILKNIFTDPQYKQISRRLWYAEIDGKKYGAGRSDLESAVRQLRPELPRGESNDPGQAPQ
jgi:hypothetical protein